MDQREKLQEIKEKEYIEFNAHKYGLLTKCEVKMAGYWPISFFCVFMDRDEHKLAKKELNEANIQPS